MPITTDTVMTRNSEVISDKFDIIQIIIIPLPPKAKP